jgi:hypothetical protein
MIDTLDIYCDIIPITTEIEEKSYAELNGGNWALYGSAGEDLVTSDLKSRGYKTSHVPQHFGFDVLVYLDDHKFIRIEVKSDEKSQLGTYSWIITRHGSGGVRKLTCDFSEQFRPYDNDAFDIIALVALDIKKIAYKKWPIPKTEARMKSFEFDRYTFESALNQYLHRNEQLI